MSPQQQRKPWQKPLSPRLEKIRLERKATRRKTKSQLEAEAKAAEDAKLSRVAAKGIFATAIAAEAFGKHPAQAEVSLELSVWQANRSRWVKLPNKKLSLLVSSIEEVDEILAVIEKGLSLWLKGQWDREARRFIQLGENN